MSMLKAFFETRKQQGTVPWTEDWKKTELCEQYMGRFPVVSIILKSVDADDYGTTRSLIVKVINEETGRMGFLLESEQLSREDKKLVSALLDKDMDDGTLCCSLRELSELLHKHYGKEDILLIDEYDVPLAKANAGGYYDPIITLIRNLFN